MPIEEWDSVFEALADDPAEYDRQGNVALLLRQGREMMISFKELPNAGLCVVRDDSSGRTSGELVPVRTFIQRDVLELPRLAQQIVRTLSRLQEKRPGGFVEGPALFQQDSQTEGWSQAGVRLRQALAVGEPGATLLMQLMAPAGQGKTVLLENVALELARDYQPNDYPTPMLLPVDLLGRYVGTIDDAIAGSLNNTYQFLGLNQRDVALCVRRRWLVLALDGFDELVARIGARESFNRITELLDQLDSKGTIVLSARESFFELYQISAAIRTYLQPRKGSYATSIITLLEWDEPQGVAFFRTLKSAEPEADLRGLLAAFGGDKKIVLHPFFLSRLAESWARGERFSKAGGLGSERERAKYIIESFVEREAVLKWVDRDLRPLLSPVQHTEVLAAVAEEMWRSGGFRLDLEELRLAAEIGAAGLGIGRDVLEAVLEKVPQHAAFTLRDRRYSFIHDQFLSYFLGHRLGEYIARGDVPALQLLLGTRELSPQTVDWAGSTVRGLQRRSVESAATLDQVRAGGGDGIREQNVAALLSRVLDEREDEERVVIRSQVFVGESLRRRRLHRIDFTGCRFWHVDLCATSLVDCHFAACQFGDIKIDDETLFSGSEFTGCGFGSLEGSDGLTVYAPASILLHIKRMGGQTGVVTATSEQPANPPRAAAEAIRIVERFVRASERTCDVAVDEMEEKFGWDAKTVAKVALEKGVARAISKGVAGPRREFIRFCVDREKLRKGSHLKTGVEPIDSFWDQLGRKFPPER